MGRLIVYGIAALLGVGAWAQPELSGRWVSNGDEVSVVLRFDTIDAGVAAEVDLPEYDQVGVPLRAPERVGEGFSLRSADKDLGLEFTLAQKGEMLAGTWNLRGREASIQFRREDQPFSFTVEKVSYQNEGVKLVAHLLLPKTPGPHPALVFFHGSGDNQRHHYWGEAAYFAERGMAVLVPDKRGNHESEGNWKDVGFETLAQDGIAGVKHMLSRDDIDARRVGVIGISQACWIMPLAATRCPDIKFIVAISGAAVTVEQEGFYDFEWRLREAGYGQDVIDRALKLVALDNQVTRGEAEMAAVVAEVKAVRKEEWFKAMEFHPAPHGMGERNFYRMIIDYDPMPVWRQVQVPVLFIYGMEDESVHAPTSIKLLAPVLEDTARDFTLQTFEGANHGIRVKGGVPEGVNLRKHAEGFFDSMHGWLVSRDFAPAEAEATPVS